MLDSAIANARSVGAQPEDLFVKTITVDKGMVMRRARPFGRGRSGTLRKTMSIVNLELGTLDGTSKQEKKDAAKAARRAPRALSGEQEATKAPKATKKVAKKVVAPAA